MAEPLSCPICRADLHGEVSPPGHAKACLSCKRPVEGLIFPAYYRPPALGKQAEILVAAEDAGCFYHPQSRAQVPCDICGRFLCALCDVELQGEHLCPACVNSGRKKKQIRNLDNERILYGGMASLIAFLPILLCWPLTMVTGPLSVSVAIYGWRKPQSLTGSGRGGSVVAIVFGLLQTVGWLLALTGVFKNI